MSANLAGQNWSKFGQQMGQLSRQVGDHDTTIGQNVDVGFDR
jgi:hypothetical protein